jgi:hypothetical protein
MKKILKKIEEIGFRSSNIMVTFSTFGDLLNKRKENDYVGRVIFTILGWIPILIILFVAVVILIKYL